MYRDLNSSARPFQPEVSSSEKAQLQKFSNQLEYEAEMNGLREAIREAREARQISQPVLLPRAAPQNTQMQTLRSFQPPVYAAANERMGMDASDSGRVMPSKSRQAAAGAAGAVESMKLTFAERAQARRAAIIAAEAAQDAQDAAAAEQQQDAEFLDSPSTPVIAAADSSFVNPAPPATISLPLNPKIDVNAIERAQAIARRKAATARQAAAAPPESQKGWFARIFEGGKHTHHRRKKSKNALSRKNCKKRYSVKAKRRNRRKSRR